MNRRILIVVVFLSIFFVLGGCSKENASNASDFTTEINDTGNTKTITITGYTGTSKDVRIPAKIDNIPVTEVGSSAFFENQLTSVTIPNGVTHIGDFAFAKNQLTSVTIPNGVTHIGLTAFSNNQLTSITIPNSVTNIGDLAFVENQLANVTISNNVTKIGLMTFAGNQLTSVTIPNGVINIGSFAFGNNQLKSISISTTVTNIGGYAFVNNQLTSVTIPNSVIDIGERAFANNQLTSVTIPNSVIDIGDGAFYNNNLATVNILNYMTNIGDGAFADNPLTNVIIDGVTYIENGVIKSQTSDVIVLDGKNGDIDDIVLDIVLDRNIYNSKSISIRDVYYNFGTRSDAISFYGADTWFDDPETYAFYQTQTMRSHNFKFWFHPVSSDREGRRYMLELNGNFYTTPQKVSINGKFYVVPLSGTTVLAFVVESFEILDKKYEGVLPSRILDPAY